MRLAVLVLLCSGLAIAQRIAGELRLQVSDPSGGAVQAEGTLTGHSTGVQRTLRTGADGRYTARSLPFGEYVLQLNARGFSPHSAAITIESQSPLLYRVTLGLSPVETSMVVREDVTLLDPQRTSGTQFLRAGEVREHPGSAPGRSLIDLVNREPGWLLEANGVLHPRGAEYDVQYVIDGIPLYDNRSPAFAQSLGVEEFESLSVRTAGYPAEFGRRLGGVIEVSTERDTREGLHGKSSLQGGSFGHATGYSSLRYTRGKTTVGISAEGMTTDRYLDSPVEQNYTNHASGGGFSSLFERDWPESDRTRVYLSHRRTGFLVPNERIQQAAGQRQDRTSAETLGQLTHSHVFSPRVLASFRAMARDTSGELWSNALSTPILPFQNRGFREAYVGGSIAAHANHHELKAGAEALFSSIHEQFGFNVATYRLNGVRILDRDVPSAFRFADRRNGRDQAFFVQDLWRLGGLTLSAGLRFDHYRLVQNETAWSPRLGVAYSVPSAGLVLRAAYDRIFQAPAIENVLLASSDLVRALGGEGAFLPLRSARGNFWEAGLSKAIGRRARLDASWFVRQYRNFGDDALLFNTGVSFPIAFHSAQIHGYEAKLDIPHWGIFSGFLSYSNLSGRANLPVAGGLFLGDEAAELVQGSGSFPITQDQRNTFRSRLRLQPHPRLWLAFGSSYNSGLPVELEGVSDPALLAEQYGARILSKINVERGRIRPFASLDASLGVVAVRSERFRARLQADVYNLAGRLNVINFAGLFSGTALGAPRNFAVGLHTDF